MLLSAETLNMLNSGGPVESKLNVLGKTWGPPPYLPQKTTYSTFFLKEAHFLKKCFFQGRCWICWILGGLLNKNVLLSREMLTMLNMLKVLGRTWGPPPYLLVLPKTFNIFNISAERSTFWFNMGPQNSTYSTFSLKEAHFSKKSFFQLICWICWILRPWVTFYFPSKHSAYSTFLQKEAHFDSTWGPRMQHIEHFPWKKHIFSKNASFSWHVEYVEFSGQGSPSNFPQNIQHIQHFRRKKHILIQHGAQNSTYSTFPLKERHFSENVLLSAEMLNMLNPLGHICVNGWCPEWESGYWIYKRY